MTEQILTRKKIKKPKVLDEQIPDLPDLNLLEIVVNDESNLESKSNIDTDDSSNKDKLELKSDDVENNTMTLNLSNNKCNLEINSKSEDNLPMESHHINEFLSVNQSIVDIQSLYPSLTQILLDTESCVLEDNKNSLDIVIERMTRPLAPVEEWVLPKPLSINEIKIYYQNTLVEHLEKYQIQFLREMRNSNHPLADLIIAYQRCVRLLHEKENKLSSARDDCKSKEAKLWNMVEQVGWREGRCRDNAILKKNFVYNEATYSVEEAKELESQLYRIIETSLDEHTSIKYEYGLNKAVVEDYLSRVKAQGTHLIIRQCLCVLFGFLRQLPVHKDCSKSLKEWIVYLGDSIGLQGTNEDRLYLLWELLHAPAGVSEWSAGLIQVEDLDLAVASLAMLLGSKKVREDLLKAWNPELSPGDAGWALVDSEGEDDDSMSSSWSLLRESDLITLLGQIPVGNIFRSALEVDKNTDDYEPGRGCHPGKLMTLMGFSFQILRILDCGLDNYSNLHYKALNKRISRLIKHTIQFLTDHLEAVLATSVIPQYDYLFPDNARLHMLSQYEEIYEYALLSLMRHRNFGNWQCLADLPWRMISPYKKWVFLTYLIDHNQSSVPEDNKWWLTNLQVVVDMISQDDAIYLLTAISNLGLESRTIINRELMLLTTITELIFQICYVIPSTRSSFSKVGRELLSSLCLQHPQTMSYIIESVKLWHPTVGQMGLFLFRELPFCLMMPSDNEFRLLSSWLLDNPPISVCNQLARQVFSNLNWGFSNSEESILYLPLSLHQRMAALLVTSYKKHTMDVKPGPWFLSESIKLVTYLWWNQEAIQDQSFHAWCLSLSIRLRLHPSTRLKVRDPQCLQPSSVVNTSDWVQAISDSQQERCSHPIAMYLAVTTSKDFNTVDNSSVKIIQNLIVRHQQYRLCLELLYQIILGSTSTQLSMFLVHDIFMNIWKQVVHADDTYYNMVKNLITKQFPGPVISCLGNSFCPSLIFTCENKEKQESVMRFFLRCVLNQPCWHVDQYFVWILDRLLEINTSLDLKTGSEEIYSIVKQFTEKQFSDASKRSGLAQIFRLGSTFNTLLNQLVTGDFMWLKSYILEAQAVVEDEIGLWGGVLHKFFIRKKRETRTLSSAINSTCKNLHIGLNVSVTNLVIVQAAQVLGSCSPDHLAIIKIAAMFFQRYLGFCRIWNQNLVGMGSAGHKLFQDDVCHPFLQQARTAIAASRTHHSTQLDALKHSNSPNVLLLDQMNTLCERLEMFLLWIDEPRLHQEEIAITSLPSQYRADLLNLARLANLNVDTLGLSRRILLEQLRQSASAWDTRHDLDFRFVRLANSVLFKPVVPLSMKLLQRFKRQLSKPSLSLPQPILFHSAIIPPEASHNTTQILEFISGPLSTLYQSAANQKANKNFLADLDKKYLSTLSCYYEQNSVNETVKIACNRAAQGCTGPAVLNMNHMTWIKRPNVGSEISRNRQDYNQLIDEIIKFKNLDQLVKGVVCMKELIRELDIKMQSSRNEDEFKRVMECGLALFFHLGRRINPETQKYPPHHIFTSQIMTTIGSKFMPFASNQANVLLNGMIENELLVEVYCPHFCPNSDTSQTSIMYGKIMEAYEQGKCTHSVIKIMLEKFNIKHYLEFSPSLTSKMSMIDILITAISYTNHDIDTPNDIDNKIEEMHVNNLVDMLCSSFTLGFPRLMKGFRSLCEKEKLRKRFWGVVSRSICDNINQHGELVLTIEEIRVELELYASWLEMCRFSDIVCIKHGLYIKLGTHVIPLTNIYGQLLESLVFKLSRSANENIVSWNEVVDKSWSLFIKIYTPWIQSFSATENCPQPEIRLPWRIEDESDANKIFESSIEKLNSILTYITIKETQSFYMHCILIWIVNGLFLPKDLPSKPYHEIYCSKIKLLKWSLLKPSADCVKLISEFISKPWMSEQGRAMSIDIVSQMDWESISSSIGGDLIEYMFELIVSIICKTRTVFKMEAVEKLADTFVEFDWDKLKTAAYEHGMDQLVASLEPRIILCNPSTIEGKIIKLLNHAAGCVFPHDEQLSCIDQAINKQTIYVSTVVKLLSVAFSFTQSKGSKNKSGDDNQIKLFQLRISGLFTEIETVILHVSSEEARQRMAISILSKVILLFENQSISPLAIDPVLEWLQESKSSPLILPFLVTLFRCNPSMSSLVRLTEELIETFILSDKSDGSHASWATISSCTRIDQKWQQQYWKESVKQSCMLCLVQQILAALPSTMNAVNIEQWQGRIVDWLDQTRPQGTHAEDSIILIIYLYLQFLLIACQTSTKPSSAFKNFIQLLLKLSESKSSTGFLGKVGLGKRSNYSFEFRMFCRSLSVFLHIQLPTNNILRIHPNDPGAVTHPDMVVPSRTLGEPLPTNKTLQHLDWLKSQRVSKELTANTKIILESNIIYMCQPTHSIVDCTNFVKQICRQLWPENKLLNLIYYC